MQQMKSIAADDDAIRLFALWELSNTFERLLKVLFILDFIIKITYVM